MTDLAEQRNSRILEEIPQLPDAPPKNTMNILLKIFREIAYAVGVLVVAIIVGDILYHAVADIFHATAQGKYDNVQMGPDTVMSLSQSLATMDRSDGAALGAGMLFGVLILVIHISRRIFWRKRIPPQAPS
ncbi:MAG: hypothetical protein ABJF10_00650 [Chthoniobacter sp.]|uniref:hypothetical protein n=1 Tax=Chthoniobacter sp. TaxID=2510640 RepID=UPI0032A792D2